MKQIDFVFQDGAGLHARPAAQLANFVKKEADTVIFSKGEKQADAKNLVKLMGLGVCQGDCIQISIAGPTEAALVIRLPQFMREIGL